jgi:hypothetical protein
VHVDSTHTLLMGQTRLENFERPDVRHISHKVRGKTSHKATTPERHTLHTVFLEYLGWDVVCYRLSVFSSR